MYQIDLRRQAYKDLESIPADYARLISNHIDSLEGNPRPHDSKKLKGIDGRVGAGFNTSLQDYSASAAVSRPGLHHENLPFDTVSRGASRTVRASLSSTYRDLIEHCKAAHQPLGKPLLST
ncbi:MAG: hypothetical protein FJZ86_14010 [Chloroflexi bacterium]|nr:hypothetical protein [Chloroflexota bacterium]